MNKLSKLDLLLAFAIPLMVITTCKAKNINDNEIGKLNACSADHRICATLTVIPAANLPFQSGYRWGGEDIEPPKTLTVKLSVKLDKLEIFIPLSAYSDLGNPSNINIKRSGSVIFVEIIGGDTSASYSAKLEFRGRHLIRRKVTSSEFPSDAFEETKYKFNTLKN